MKNEILDDNFNDDLRNQLEVDENVIWEWSPPMSKIIIIMIIGNLLQITIIFYHFKSINSFSAIFVFILFCIAIYCYNNYKQVMASKNRRYLITNQRVIFQTNHKDELNFYSIPFQDISYVSVYPDFFGKKGMIMINLKKDSKSKKLPQVLTLHKTGDGRPTLEEVDNVREIGKYIKLGIENKL